MVSATSQSLINRRSWSISLSSSAFSVRFCRWSWCGRLICICLRVWSCPSGYNYHVSFRFCLVKTLWRTQLGWYHKHSVISPEEQSLYISRNLLVTITSRHCFKSPEAFARNKPSISWSVLEWDFSISRNRVGSLATSRLDLSQWKLSWSMTV